MHETLRSDISRDGVTVVRLNRPERLNAINGVMVTELAQTFAAVGADPDVHAVVLTGTGRGFCSGIDMRNFGPEMLDATRAAIDRLRFQEAMAALPQAIRAIAPARHRGRQRPVRRRRPGTVPGR